MDSVHRERGMWNGRGEVLIFKWARHARQARKVRNGEGKLWVLSVEFDNERGEGDRELAIRGSMTES
jgi:hypothetical protein